jgi:hypothetical protein
MLDRLSWRRRRRVAQLLASLLVSPAALAVFVPVAHAQQAPAGGSQQEAKRLFEAGVKASKAGNYQEALAAFLESYRQSPRVSTLRNIVRTHRYLNDNAAAYASCQTMLTQYATAMTPAERADAQQILHDLELLTGVIAVGVQEPGAKVTIDGKDIGETPIAKPVRLDMGKHTVTITKVGFETIAQQVDLEPGQNTANVDGPLQKEVLTGHVNVTALPPDPTAKVFVDEKEVGAVPWQGDVDPGLHTIQVRGATQISEARSVEVARKGTYDVNLTLHTQGAMLAVTVNTPDADISIDGKLVGKGGLQQPVSAGRHVLTVAKVGYATYKKDFVVADGEKVVESVALLPPSVAAGVAPHDWTGFYEQFTLLGIFGPTTPQNDITKGTGYDPSVTSVNSNKAAGGGLNVGVGYSLGIVGFEGSFMFTVDHSSAHATTSAPPFGGAMGSMPGGSAQHPNPGTTGGYDQMAGGVAGPTTNFYPYTENYDFYHVGGDLTVGARVMPKIETVRPTLAIAGGMAIKAACYNRGVAGPLADNTVGCNFVTYLAPALKIDGGIELGSTPGTRFYLSLLFLAEFSRSVSAGIPPTPAGAPINFPSPQINVVTGPEFYLGPMLGMQFGE